MRPILPAEMSVNHRAPSGPAEMARGWVLGVVGGGSRNSVTAPLVEMRPILSWEFSVNQMAWSGPTARSRGALETGNSVNAPLGVTRQMLAIFRSRLLSENHRLPSGPATRPAVVLLGRAGMRNSVMLPLVVIRPIRPPAPTPN